MHPLYDVILKSLETDAGQMVEEGHDLSALKAEIEAARAKNSLDALAELQQDFWQRPSPPDFAYDEPDDWDAIAASFPSADSHERFTGGQDELGQRLLGAWQGRCVGCQLGKPLEGAWPDRLRRLCEASGSWPLEDYLAPIEPNRLEKIADKEDRQWLTKQQWLTKGNFDRVAPDDDIHYAIIGLTVLERCGIDFTANDVADELLKRCLRSDLYASGLNMFRMRLLGLPSPTAAMFDNPCRQSLGATIRCDPYGWAAPANPALAAKLAWQDAIGSQRRNGIYAGMFFAVMMADVLAHGDVPRAINTAAKYVPPQTRFAEMLSFVNEACAAMDDWQDVNEEIYRQYDRGMSRAESLKMNHCLPNAAIVLMALLKGGGDFTRTVGISVMAGMDTDCNGATAGSIMGCALGAVGIPAHWTNPLGDRIETHLLDYYDICMSDLAARTLQVAWRNARC